MRTLIISDLHLTHRNYSKKKFQYISNLLKNYDQVIINGDLWCAFTSTFDQFLNSKWSALFDLLLERNCIYVEGNHDLFEYSDPRIARFCVKGCEVHKISAKDKDIIITHGHKQAYDWHKSKLGVALRRLTRLESLSLLVEALMIRIFGKNTFFKIYRIFGNQKQKRASKALDGDNLWVFGHTHCFEDDISNGYINVGRIGNWYASYISIVDNEIKLNFDFY